MSTTTGPERPRHDWRCEADDEISDEARCTCGLTALRATVADLKRRAKLATRYLKSVSSGQFVTAALVVAAIRTLDTREPLPLLPAKPRAKVRKGARK